MRLLSRNIIITAIATIIILLLQAAAANITTIIIIRKDGQAAVRRGIQLSIPLARAEHCLCRGAMRDGTTERGA